MFSIWNRQFGQQNQGGQFDSGDRLAGRIMAAEYNLAAQQGDTWQATQALGLLIGQFLLDAFGGGR